MWIRSSSDLGADKLRQLLEQVTPGAVDIRSEFRHVNPGAEGNAPDKRSKLETEPTHPITLINVASQVCVSAAIVGTGGVLVLPS